MKRRFHRKGGSIVRPLVIPFSDRYQAILLSREQLEELREYAGRKRLPRTYGGEGGKYYLNARTYKTLLKDVQKNGNWDNLIRSRHNYPITIQMENWESRWTVPSEVRRMRRKRGMEEEEELEEERGKKLIIKIPKKRKEREEEERIATPPKRVEKIAIPPKKVQKIETAELLKKHGIPLITLQRKKKEELPKKKWYKDISELVEFPPIAPPKKKKAAPPPPPPPPPPPKKKKAESGKHELIALIEKAKKLVKKLKKLRKYAKGVEAQQVKETRRRLKKWIRVPTPTGEEEGFYGGNLPSLLEPSVSLADFLDQML